MFDDILDTLLGRKRQHGTTQNGGLRGMLSNLDIGDREDDDNRNRRRQDSRDFDLDGDDFDGRDRHRDSDRSRRSDRDGMDWD